MLKFVGALPAWSRRVSNSVVVLNAVALVLASWTPRSYVIRSNLIPGQVEHFITYFVTGVLTSAASNDRVRPWGVAGFLVLFAACMEVGQIFVPGRTAALDDFGAGALGAVVGVLGFQRVARKFSESKLAS
jgi:VanZ family protein